MRASRDFISTTVYALRDIGQAGGWIYYIESLGGGSYKYYECAITDIKVSGSVVTRAWSNVTGSAVTGTGTAVGTGKANTLLIIAQPMQTASAAKMCDDLVA
jgi:hypothetical protein